MASKNRRRQWLKVFTNFANGAVVTCPNCGSHELKDGYIELDKAEHIGWGAFWCEECYEAFVISRINLIDETLRIKIMPTLPDNLKFV